MLQFPAIAKRVSDRQSAGEPAGLLAFHAERPSGKTEERPHRPARRRIVLAAVILLGLFAGAAVVYWATTQLQAARAATPAPPPTGLAVLDSHPPGTVAIDGVVRGATPLSLRLPAGRHTVVITAGEAERKLALDIDAGSTTRQDVEFAAAAPATAGRLEVTSEPPGARVSVDGAPKGATPVSVAEIAAGPHQITISSGETTIRRRVTVVAGAMSSVDASIASSESAAGWLALTSPVELTLAEDDQIVGTTKAARVMLPAGTHNLMLANPSLEFQTTMAVRIDSGKTMRRAIAVPNGSLSVNAAPWANVSVDGTDVGTTPLANVTLPIGTHEVVWRHPQLGERRRTIAITARTPTRIGMDLRQ